MRVEDCMRVVVDALVVGNLNFPNGCSGLFFLWHGVVHADNSGLLCEPMYT